MKYMVSDTDRLRKVHLFVWAEPYDGAAETRKDYFSVQDLPDNEARARTAAFLDAARTQSRSSNPASAAAAADAVAQLETLIARNP